MKFSWNRSLPPWLVLTLVCGLGAIGLVATQGSGAGGWQGTGIDVPTSHSDLNRRGSSDLLQSYPGIVQPGAVAASEARIGDHEEVVGVVVNGKPRAYLLRAMSHPHQHVVNDTIGTVPVSVTYCSIERCARAFTLDKSTDPLDLAVGGQHNTRGLLLLVDGRRFLQSTQEPYAPGATSQPFPYQSLPITVTSWKAWRDEHPDTELSRPAEESVVRPPPVERAKPRAAG